MSSIVDIISFCEDERFLSMNGQNGNISLWPMQKIILKSFYRGTIGNENIIIYDNETDLIKKISKENKFDYENENELINQLSYSKYDIDRPSILLNVFGRQGSKTTLSAIIACYEAYKLLETPNGNPQAYYNLFKNTPISILAVEMNLFSSLFDRISRVIALSPYFKDKIGIKSTNHKIHILTEEDKKENKKIGENSTNEIYGSIVIQSIRKDVSLRGNNAICVLMDEFSNYKNQDAVFNSLLPAVSKFKEDGKVIISASPLDRKDFLWNLFEKPGNKTVIQLPTWAINQNLTKEVILNTPGVEENSQFHNEYGARFVGFEEFDEEKDMLKSGKSIGEIEYWKKEAKKAFEKRDAALKELKELELSKWPWGMIEPRIDMSNDFKIFPTVDSTKANRIKDIFLAKYWFHNDPKISMIISFYSSFISALKTKVLQHEISQAATELLVCGELNLSKEREVINPIKDKDKAIYHYELKNGGLIKKLFKTLKYRESLEELYLLDMKNIEVAKAIKDCNKEIWICCGMPSYNSATNEMSNRFIFDIVNEIRNILYDCYAINQDIFLYSVDDIIKEAKQLI